MKSLARILFLLLVSCGPLFSEGIPVDRKTRRVNVPHTVLTLSDSQVEEVETMNTLTLDSEQWKKLRKIGPYCPKRFEILPVTWNDCSCGIGFYGIQLSRNQVAVTEGQLNFEGGLNLFTEDDEAGSDSTTVWLTVDRRGQFYSKGVLVPFALLLERVAETSGKYLVEKEERQRWLGVQYPLGLDRKSGALKSRLDQLFQAAHKSGWETADDHL